MGREGLSVASVLAGLRAAATRHSPAGLGLTARPLERLPLGFLVSPRLEGRRVRKLIFFNVHGQLQTAALGILRHLQPIELHGHALLADPEEAADADHKAFDGLGILAEDEIADAADFGFVGSKDGLAN